MTKQELKAACYRIIDLVDYVERIEKLGDCNTCICKRNCPHAPKPGQMVRINCFSYVGEDEVVK